MYVLKKAQSCLHRCRGGVWEIQVSPNRVVGEPAMLPAWQTHDDASRIALHCVSELAKPPYGCRVEVRSKAVTEVHLPSVERRHDRVRRRNPQ
jgi:hypothetical protein